MNTRPSYLLTTCGVFAIVATLQILSSPIWISSMDSSEWRIAWCGSLSPLRDWILLYAWSIFGIGIAYCLFRGLRIQQYALTILSYSCFWLIAFYVNPIEPDWKEDLFVLAFFGAAMLWSFYRYGRRTALATQTMKQEA
jgi:hypothetical protein